MVTDDRPNWVAERAKFRNMRSMLDELASIVNQDIEQANEILDLGQSPITVERETVGFQVLIPSHPRPKAVIFSETTENRIKVGCWWNPSTIAFEFLITPQWDFETCSCRAMVEGGRDYAPWQIVQQALGWLIFEDRPTIVPRSEN